LRQLDARITASRKLRFFAYSATKEMVAQCGGTHKHFLDLLVQLGFRVNPLVKWCETIEQALDFYKYIEQERTNLGYDIDGVVYKVDSIGWQQRLGAASRAPRWAIAHKFAASQAETVIEDILVQVGRTGVLTPVAILQDVHVGGVIIKRATLHNQEEIERKDVRIGDTVVVQRAGDVIPQVVRVVPAKRPVHAQIFHMPSCCPVCQRPVEKIPGQVAVRCPGRLQCPAQALEALRHFVSRDAFDIEGLGEKHLEAFYAKGLIATPVDLFTLQTRDASSLTPLKCWPGWGEQSAQNLFTAIDKRREITLDRFIYALGIPQFGQQSAKLLARHYMTADQWWQAMQNLAQEDDRVIEELTHLNGIGESMIQDLRLYMREPIQRDLVRQLLQVVHVKPAPVAAVAIQSPLIGRTIVFTGSLQHMTRPEAKARAEALGAKVASAVSRHTDFVVAGAEAGSKLKQAQAFGVKIITEEEWMEMLGT
jgi:DNA ligase (NAD+)